ncbi:hypothetical protein VPH35_062444 [Triticum aestivum]
MDALAKEKTRGSQGSRTLHGPPSKLPHHPCATSSRAHAHLRANRRDLGPKRRSKAPSEGEVDMTTQIRSPEPRGRSTRPRQVAAELDREQATIAAPQPSAQPAPARAGSANRSRLQPADEREP